MAAFIPPECDRCIFEFTDGRRCRGWRIGNGCFLCHPHQKAQERRQAREAADRAAAEALPLGVDPGKFVNLHPKMLENFLPLLNDKTLDAHTTIHFILENVLRMLLGNGISVRAANSAAQLLRQLAKLLPLLDRERNKAEQEAARQRLNARLREIIAQNPARPTPPPEPAEAATSPDFAPPAAPDLAAGAKVTTAVGEAAPPLSCHTRPLQPPTPAPT